MKNIYKKIIKLFFVTVLFVPAFAFAQIGPSIIGADEWGTDKDGNPVYIGPAATDGIDPIVTTYIGGAGGDPGIKYPSGTTAGFCPSIDAVDDLGALITFVICFIMKALVPLAFAVALLLFIVGVIKYVINADNETKRKEGGKFILWGIVALFVMVSVWGLVAVLGNTFGVETAIPQLPIAPTTTY